jgi:6-phosphogluconate dehydrogenase
MVEKADIGLIGLAVMGQNLVLNMADHGYRVSVFNRSSDKMETFIHTRTEGRKILGFHTLEKFVSSLSRPRKVMIMIKAGAAVDTLISELIPLLESGDIIVDGGNALYTDTTRRTKFLQDQGIIFIGTGISGGEEGARHGPSIMPGGNKEGWAFIEPIFKDISAKVQGESCCDWVGEDGAGHYVKMVHNGIEYGDMQLIAEVYWLMRYGLKMSAMECHAQFKTWNEGVLNSYLIEITADILRFKDVDGTPLIDKILDTAGQKGTGKWTAMNALDLGMPLSLITESVYARCLSALKEERVEASKAYTLAFDTGGFDKREILSSLHDALYASKIISYTQGYMLMREAAKEYGWSLNFGGIALMWRGGCIIRSAFLDQIKRAYEENSFLDSLMMDDFFKTALIKAHTGWRKTIVFAIERGLPVPAISSALAFFDGYRSGRVSANMLQAQRDYFGAHTYERIDAQRGVRFHTDWIGSGGNISSSSYEV